MAFNSKDVDAFTKSIDNLNNSLSLNSNSNPLTPNQQEQFRSDGFLLPATPSADGSGLPFSKVQDNKSAQFKRNIITWFVPGFGIVRMFINPNNINYQYKKLINADRTKGGYTVQYWGEELTTLDISGTTGSSGVEGINMLYEIYRAEQYSFDAVGLTMANNNAAADVSNNIVNGIGGFLGSTVQGAVASGGNSSNPGAGAALGSSILGGVLGLDSPTNNLAPKNIPSLAQNALSVEMFYQGWVFRGWFENFRVTERADNFLWDYQMTFKATQRRGYRVNNFPFNRSPIHGPSQYGTPSSIDPRNVKR